jgi:hypothetical protein
VTPRAAALAATTALGLAATLAACGEKEVHVSAPSRAEVRSLVAAGLAAAGSDAAPGTIAFNADGPALRIGTKVMHAEGPLLRLAASFRGVRAEIVPFCPKPALLRCRPALRAWTSPWSPDAQARVAAALRRLAASAYGERLLVRRRGHVTRLVTANGELLAAVRRTGSSMALSFGGLPVPHAAPDIAPGRVEIEANVAGLAAMRAALPPEARLALAGMRRLVMSLALR